MPHVMPAEVGDPGLTERLLKRVAQIEGRPAIGAGEEQRCINPTYADKGVDRLQGDADQGQRARLAVFRVGQGQLGTSEVDIVPGEAGISCLRAPVLKASRTTG